MVELINPPITDNAIGEFISWPAPLPKAKGSMAPTMANVVINMGRNRFSPAWISASSTDSPCFIALLAKSTTNMAFLPTIPNNKMMPIMTNNEKLLPLRPNAVITPVNANGIVTMIIIG